MVQIYADFIDIYVLDVVNILARNSQAFGLRPDVFARARNGACPTLVDSQNRAQRRDQQKSYSFHDYSGKVAVFL